LLKLVFSVRLFYLCVWQCTVFCQSFRLG
jgi:hypothetical protein